MGNQIGAIWTEELTPLVSDYAIHFSMGTNILAARNEDMIFSSASMTKLMIADAYLGHTCNQADLANQVVINWEQHAAAGDGILKGLQGTQTFTLEQYVHLMLTLSDNIATNVLINHAGGVGPMNSLLAARGYTASGAFLHGTVGGKERISDDYPAPQPAENLPTRWCLGSVTAKTVTQAVQNLKETEIGRNALLTQQDHRSVARHLYPNEHMGWKTGTADGLVHAGGVVTLPGYQQDLLFSVLTDRSINESESCHSNTLDEPIFKAMGKAMRRTLDHLYNQQLS